MKLDSSNYFSLEMQNKYMGFSQFKSFVPQLGGCEAKAKATLSGEWEDKEKTVFMVGKYVHSWSEGKLEQFIEMHPEIKTARGQLRAEYVKANLAIERIERDKLFMLALSGEKEVIVTAELFGIPFKIMIDSLFEKEKRFTDLKYIKEIPGKVWNVDLQLYETAFEAYGYYLQAAIYSKVLSLSRNLPSGEYYEPFIAAVSKEDTPDMAIISFVSDQEPINEFVESQLEIVGRFIERVKSVKSGEIAPMRCEKCDYCKNSKELKTLGTTFYKNLNLYGDEG